MRKLPGRKRYGKGFKVGLGVKDKGQGEVGERRSGVTSSLMGLCLHLPSGTSGLTPYKLRHCPAVSCRERETVVHLRLTGSCGWGPQPHLHSRYHSRLCGREESGRAESQVAMSDYPVSAWTPKIHPLLLLPQEQVKGLTMTSGYQAFCDLPALPLFSSSHGSLPCIPREATHHSRYPINTCPIFMSELLGMRLVISWNAL
ncbi:unnamed protein product [Rangifer tarandus platyrhynchus]|uniref:Uncharacterized protein n=1 Tax=Rangifer tarandus platyrhynchus TaxID=3082113 RepID=A0ABN8YRW8_RANTA|nr:unnamed protein product [Rangifer tarandus platyrhynchus]